MIITTIFLLSKGESIMKFKQEGNLIILRLDKGEEVFSSIMTVCRTLNVKCGMISGLGAVSTCTLGVYNVEEKQYCQNEFKGDFEVTNLTGSVTTKDGECYLHLHITLGDDKGHALGGHLNEAIISVTAEIFIQTFPLEVEREVDKATGLNFFAL